MNMVVNASPESLKKEMEDIKAELREERSKRKKAEAKARKLDQHLRYAQKNKFGDKRQKARKDGDKKDDVDREEEKDRFDGTDGTVSTKSVQWNPVEERPVNKKKERDLSNRQEKYDTMSVEGAPVFHPTDDSKVPGRIIERKSIKVFSFKMCLVEGLFDMVHYVEPGKKPRWGYFPKEGLTEALNYLDKFWDRIFAYQNDWNYPIDNNIAERTIRKLTTERNNSLHYGSDEGVGMAVAYHSVISTVKLHGMSCWEVH